jgi:hypothetical protein
LRGWNKTTKGIRTSLRTLAKLGSSFLGPSPRKPISLICIGKTKKKKLLPRHSIYHQWNWQNRQLLLFIGLDLKDALVLRFIYEIKMLALNKSSFIEEFIVTFIILET